ncbi:hypothetical protein L2E82_11688 [Cichorium intybus]|uniref:Uncharacterized protein n=1 Tax=Cichorium intybus TaxID=13427 RepID=A0ACB9GF48_CICIN|nr:hypothetical protein L2E82_11688 [Cichorium intybus]
MFISLHPLRSRYLSSTLTLKTVSTISDLDIFLPIRWPHCPFLTHTLIRLQYTSKSLYTTISNFHSSN